MKQAILTFEKQNVLLVELPEGAYGVGQQHIYHGEDPITFHIKGKEDECHNFYFEGFVELIGKLSELQHDAFIKIVDRPEGHEFHYINYEGNNPWISARESFLSKLRAENYGTVNPHGQKPADDDYSFFTHVNLSLKEAWEICEARTFRPEQTFVFKIIKQSTQQL